MHHVWPLGAPTSHQECTSPIWQAVHHVWPLGAPTNGGTAITLFGEGFASFDAARAPQAMCRFLPVQRPSAWCERFSAAAHRTVPRR